jgi:hypothetical protein
MEMAHKISGDHCTDGYHDGFRGTFWVDIVDGYLFDTYGDELYLRDYGSDATILTNGCWEFWPDNRSLQHLASVGITPTQMIV